MYRDVKETKWQEWYGVTQDNKPDVAIIWGIFSSIMEEGFRLVPDFLEYQFKPYLTNIRHLKLPHTFVGDYKNLNVAVTHAYGGPYCLDQTLKLVKFGAKLLILMGHFGSLKNDIAVGKIFIPSAAFRSDGASFHLLGDEDRFVHPTVDVESWLHTYLANEKIPYETGPIKTVSTMTSQSERMIEEWRRQGFVGVDLESAVVFSIAKIHNVKCVSILHHSDHVGGGRLIFDITEQEREAKKVARKQLVQIGLKVAEQFGNKNDANQLNSV
ncbi:MAG: hypothetical protein AABW61_03560 [Candidatus Aenigmatarchaeota archaeon]